MKLNEQQAFPRPIPGETGVTLRDYFAAAALQGLSTKGWGAGMTAAHAYSYADAMLAERAKQKT